MNGGFPRAVLKGLLPFWHFSHRQVALDGGWKVTHRLYSEPHGWIPMLTDCIGGCVGSGINRVRVLVFFLNGC